MPGAGHIRQPSHQVPLPNNSEEAAAQLQAEYNAEAEAKVKRTTFTCAICLDVSNFDNSVWLDCEHRFCIPCMQAFLTGKIREKRCSEMDMRCPLLCEKPLTELQIQWLLSNDKPTWDRFLDTRARRFKTASTMTVECPGRGCEYGFLLPADWTGHVSCQVCKLSFCPLCHLTHPRMTCKEAIAREDDGLEVSTFEKLVRDMKWQKCPKCQAATERAAGCNFMSCPSDKCRGQTHFCYLCGEELWLIGHISHFPRGPFRNQCNNVDKSDDNDIPPANTENMADPQWWKNMADEVWAEAQKHVSWLYPTSATTQTGSAPATSPKK